MPKTHFKPLPYPQTLESARAYFLRGQLKGTWGEAHKTAVLLGLKPNPDAPHKTAA